MALPAIFQSLVTSVDATKTLVTVLNTSTYGINEWSHDGNLTITGGSDRAQQHGARALLIAKGFRYYGSRPDKFIKNPASITIVSAAAKQENFWPFNSFGPTYGEDGSFPSEEILEGWLADWKAFNCFDDDRMPAGHRWGDVILTNLAYFQANTSLILGGAPTGGQSDRFDLSACINSSGVVTNAPMVAQLAHICAAHLLNDGLNAEHRTHFDPTDSNPHNAAQVCRFTKAVVDKMRAGTAAIATIAAQSAVADAQLTILAYSNHADPTGVNFSITGIGVQVATAFNDTGFSIAELIEDWGAIADFIALREYGPIVTWTENWPRSESRQNKNYVTRYDSYKTAGAVGMRMEGSINWLVDLVANYLMVEKATTGTAVPATIIAEIVTNIFSGDAKVTELYTAFGLAKVSPNKYMLAQWAVIVDDMQAGWYKDAFEQIITILYRKTTLPATSNSGFGTAFSAFMGCAYDLLGEGYFHEYGLARRLARTAFITSAWAPLKWDASPIPQWRSNPTAWTGADFDTALAVLEATAFRPPELDTGNHRLLKITPPPSFANASGEIWVLVSSIFGAIGPGTAVFTPNTGSPITKTLVPGLNIITTFPGAGRASATDGGRIFLNCFPQCELYNFSKSTFGAHDLVAYVPTEIAGEADVVAQSRITITWSGGSCTILSPGNGGGPTTTIPAGPVRVACGSSLTYNRFSAGNLNQWLSPYGDLMLLTEEAAEKDFPAFLSITPPLAEGSDDSNPDPIVD